MNGVKDAGKKVWFGGVGCVAFGSVALGLFSFQHVPTIAPNTFVGPVELGGLTHEDAAKKLRIWWESKKREPLTLAAPGIADMEPLTPGMLGYTLDDAQSVAPIPVRDFWSATGEQLGVQQSERSDFPLLLKPNGQKPTALAKRVEALSKAKPARVRYAKGAIFLSYEGTRKTLDMEGLSAPVATAVRDGGPVLLPITEAPKKVKDEELAKIREVVSTFSTPFAPSKRDRSTNLRTAASKLDGIVLAPGENLSFNQTVGERTIQNGFREAIVFEEGRQTPGVGGGICQVSSTLYNAALFANLKIVQRRNHSIPVPYVSLGRDATVYWGAVDLVIQNNYDFPIGISAEYGPGRLVFRVLGQKVPGQEVKVVASGASSFAPVTQTVRDPSLPAGVRKVRERGSGGRAISTFRLVYQNGQLVKREPLGLSRYRGEVQVVAVGTGAGATPAPAAQAEAPPTFSDQTPP